MTASFLHAASWRVLATVSSTVTVFLSFRLYDQHLSRELFGILQVAVQILTYLPLLDGGFRLVTNRELLEGGQGAGRRPLLLFLQSLYTWMGSGAVVLGVGLMWAYGQLPGTRVPDAPLSLFLTLGTVGALVAFATAQTQLLVGLGLQSRVFVLNTIQSWLYLAGLALGFRAGLGAWSFPLSLAVTWSILLPVVWRWIRSVEPGLPRVRWRLPADFTTLFRTHRPAAFAALHMQGVLLMLYSADLVLVQILAPGPGAGTYILAARIFTMVRTTLQAADEAIWPILAQKAVGSMELSQALVRFNGWLYGAVLASATVAIPRFIGAYMVQDWSPAPWVVPLLALRSLITGLSSQPAYYLLARGRFDTLARFLTLELLLCLGLATVLGRVWGTAGIALGFVLGSVGGTGFPIPLAYLQMTGPAVLRFFMGLWGRALISAILAGGSAYGLMSHLRSWWMVVLGGAVVAGVTLTLPLGLAWWRALRTGRVDLPTLTRFI